jgi:hypothetical protein
MMPIAWNGALIQASIAFRAVEPAPTLLAPAASAPCGV